MKIPAVWQKHIDAGTPFGYRAQAAIEARSSRGVRRAVRPVSQDQPCTGCSKPRTLMQTITHTARQAVTRVQNLTGAAVDFLQDGMAVASPEQQEHRRKICAACPLNNDGWCDLDRGGCGCNLAAKVTPRSSSCPQGKWFEYRDLYRPLVNPTRNLIFHIYPRVGKEWNWHWHLDQIRRAAPVFNGEIILATVTGPELAPAAEVRRVAEGIPVSEWIVKPNTRLAETETHLDLLRAVQTDDPNTITLRGHTKGVTHRPEQHEQEWARLMWEACLDLPSVEDALSSHLMAGSLKCHKPITSKHQGYEWFYAGTFFWFRNREIFQREWSVVHPTRWFVEEWPGILCARQEAACLCYDSADGSVFRGRAWADRVAPAFERWRAARKEVV